MENIEKINEKLKELSDKEYKEFNLKLCPDTNKEMLGIKIPLLRNIAKQIIKENLMELYLDNARDFYFEEVILQGLVIAYSKIPLEQKLEYIEKYIPKIDSWAITDTFTPALKIKQNELKMFWDFIFKFVNSKREFEVRFAIVSMLDYYIIDEYVDDVIKILDKIKHEGYYVKMAIAWTLAEIGIKYNEKAIQYLKSNNNLDKFTYNKTLQKMIESFRIPEEQKSFLRKMKR